MNLNLSNGVFHSLQGIRTFSERTFYLIIRILVVVGLVGMGCAANYSVQAHLSFTTWQIWFIGLGIPIIGTLIALNCGNSLFSFIGYMLLVAPLGVILGPAIANFDNALVMRATLLTGGVTALMTFGAFIRPSWFANVGGVLFTGLSCLVLIRLVQLFVPALQDLKVIDYISAGVFSLYIGYDIYRVQRIDRTMDGAIGVAVGLYLNIVNLFVGYLSSESGDI